MVAGAVSGLERFPGVATFVVPAEQIARYAAITQGVDVDRVPALVVVTPEAARRRASRPPRSATASRARRASCRRSIDAGYKGRTLDYHP